MVEKIIKLSFLYIVAFASLVGLFYGLISSAEDIGLYVAGGYSEMPVYPSSCYGSQGGICTEEEKMAFEKYNIQSASYSKDQQKGVVVQSFARDITQILVSLIGLAGSMMLLRKHTA